MQNNIDTSLNKEDYSKTVSIIVPIYNAEKYLKHCVESIFNQTYTNWELLLVDDGSPDKCGEICDEYAKKDRRLRVVHKRNGGVSSARNAGVENANGEWLTFVDSDDALLPNALEEMIKCAGVDTDIVVGTLPNDKRIEKIKGNSVDAACYLKLLYDEKISAGPVCKLFRTSIFPKDALSISRSIPFGEDLLMNINVAVSNKKPVALCRASLYVYNQVPESCMHTFQMTFDYAVEYFNLKERLLPSTLLQEYKTKGIGLTHKFRFLNICIKCNKYKSPKHHKYFDMIQDDLQKCESGTLGLYDRIILYAKSPVILFPAYVLERLIYKLFG